MRMGSFRIIIDEVRWSGGQHIFFLCTHIVVLAGHVVMNGVWGVEEWWTLILLTGVHGRGMRNANTQRL